MGPKPLPALFGDIDEGLLFNCMLNFRVGFIYKIYLYKIRKVGWYIWGNKFYLARTRYVLPTLCYYMSEKDLTFSIFL